MDEKIKSIIIDDELIAIKNIELNLIKYQNIEVIQAFTNFHMAISYLNSCNDIDVVFLDINLGQFSGFELLSQISHTDFEIVFITAYNEFAINAFKVNALDYILKPIDEEDFERTIQKLIIKTNSKKHNKDTVQSLHFKNMFLQLREQGNNELIKIKDILYIEAKGAYSNIFFYSISNDKVIYKTISKNIAEYEHLLSGAHFIRTHKSYMINSEHITGIKSNTLQKHIILSNNIKIPISRRKHKEVIQLINGS